MERFEERYIEARKKLIEADFAALNPMQRKAVMATEGPLLILAGAGSGKTTVLINRIANLLRYGKAADSFELPLDASEEDIAVMEAGGDRARALAAYEPVEPWRILAITFTNKAANEIKDRLVNMLGADAHDIWASTFHSACVRILRRDCESIGYPDSFTIYDTNDSLSVIKHILKEFELEEKHYPPRSILGEISRAKDSFLTPKEYEEYAWSLSDDRKRKIAQVYAEYDKRCKSAGAMDFDDLIFNTVRLLKENEKVRSYWQRRFRYVLIDEYQDTNMLQYELAALLSGGYENICVVGDDDQSIYKFRGATIENILSFEEQYKGCRVIRLEQNYRSTAHILDAANAVIRNNLGRKGKELWTNGDRGDRIELYRALDERDEGRYVAQRITAHVAKGGAWSDNAVLYRMNAQSNQLEQAFKRSGIPYRIYGGTGFFDRAEVKDMLAYLCVIASPHDDLRLMRIVNVPARGIGQTSMDRAAAIASERGLSLFQVMENAAQYPELGRAAGKMRQFADMISELNAFSQLMPPQELYDLLLEKTGYLMALVEKHTVEDDARAENVRELKSGIMDYMKTADEPTLAGYLADIALYTDLDTYSDDGNCVTMMTLHSAKGLEFENVYIVGMEEGIFPGNRSLTEPEELEEERRLCYVGITRAKKKLYMTCAEQRMLFGKTTANPISRFVDEIPEAHIRKTNVPAPKGYDPFRTEFVRQEAPKKHTVPALKPQETKEAPAFKTGDRIKHRAFGEGTIVSEKPMGNDFLIEIAFDGGFTKKLMLRAAALFMEAL